MNLEVRYSSGSLKSLGKVDTQSHSRIMKSIRKLQTDPFPRQTKRVEGSRVKLFRIRIGSYRLLYEVDHAAGILGIIKIDRRARVYD